MRATTRIWVVLLSIIAATSIFAQESQPRQVDELYKALNPRTREVIETYLRTDCEIGEVGKALKAVLEIASVAKPYLLAVRHEGPPQPVLSDFQRGLANTWEAREGFLKSPDALELGKESFEMMRSITRERYEKDQLNAIQAKYRERAELALQALK